MIRSQYEFGRNEIKFLGIIVNNEEIRVNDEYIKVIAKMPALKNITEVKSLLGMINHYDKLVPHLHTI